MKRSGYTPNQQHQAFTSLQTFSYNQPDKSSRSKHNYRNYDSSNNNYNYNYQPNKNNFRKKSSNNFNQPKISIEKPREKQAATTAFSIGIGQDQISSSPSTSLDQPEIIIERRKTPKLEFRSSNDQNLIISSKKIESKGQIPDSQELTAKLNLTSKDDEDQAQANQNQFYDNTNPKENHLNKNNGHISEASIQVPIKDFYTPEDILSLKPSSPPSKRIQASGFITFLRFFSEDSQENNNYYEYGRYNKSYKKNRNNRNYNWKNGKTNSKKMTLREHSENRFVGLSMVSRAGLNNEFSEEIKRSQTQFILNKLNKTNIAQSLNEIKSLKIPLDVIIDLLLDSATSDSDFPERNPQIGNMLDFTFRFCSINSEFKSKLISKSLSKSEDINNIKNPFAPIGSLQSTITWLAALFAGFIITDHQFVNFANQVIEKQPIERALEIIRTGLYVGGKSLDQRNQNLGQPLFDFLQNNQSKHGYTNFLISELFFLRNSGWNINAIDSLQYNGRKKKAINIVKRSTSQTLIQGKQESDPSSIMISSSSTSNFSKLAIIDSNESTNYYNKDILLQSVDEIELLFLNDKSLSTNLETDSNLQQNSISILNFIHHHKLETVVHICFFLFKKYIQNANDFASFTEKLIIAFIQNSKKSTNKSKSIIKSTNNSDTQKDDNIGSDYINTNNNIIKEGENKNSDDVQNNDNFMENNTNAINRNENNASNDDISGKVCSLILNEQSLFESIVREEESKQLWFPVFVLNAYLYSDSIIPFDFIVQSYNNIPDDCFKPSKVSFINKIAEITGVQIDDVEKLYKEFHTKTTQLKKQQIENDENAEKSEDISESNIKIGNKIISLGNNNDDSDEKIVEALINLCNPLEMQYNPETEISAGVFIRDIFDEIFENTEEEVIKFEIIKISFEPYKEIVDQLIKKYSRITNKIILNSLQQCKINQEQKKSALEFFHMEQFL